MNTRKRFYVPTILLLLISLAAFAFAQDKQELLIDSARNAVLKVTTGGPAEGISGQADMQADFKQALLGMKGDLKFGPEIQKDLNGGSGALFVNAATAMLEIVGDLDLPIPPSPDMPKKLTGKIESVFNESKSYAKGNLDIEAPSQTPVPKMDFKGNLDASGQAVSGKLNFTVDLEQNAASMPFKEFNINVSEKDTSSNITVGVSMDGKSPMADNLRQMGKNPDAIKQAITQNLAAAKITVEKVEIGEFKDTPEAVSGSLSILIKDWRGTVKQQLDQASKSQPQNQDAQQMVTAVSSMIQTKIDSFNIKLTIDGNNLKGDLDWGLSQTQGFLLGYADLASAIMKAAGQDMDGNDKAREFATALNQVQAEELKKVVQIIIDSNAKLKLQGDLAIENKPAAGETPSADKQKGADAAPGFTAKANFNLDVENYKAYVEKAVAANLPMGKNQALLLDLNMTEDQHLKGKLFATTDGKLVDYYKNLALNTLGRMKGMEKVSGIIKSVELKGGAVSVNLTKEGVTFSGYGEASDMTGLAKQALEELSKQSGFAISGQPLGMSMDFKSADNKGTAEINTYFADFMKGKSDADVKKTMGVDVNSKATAEQTKLVAVSKPEVKIPENLVALEKEGQGMLSAPAIALPGVGGGSGGGSSLPIIGGVAVLVLLGVGVAAGRGKK